MFEGFKLERIDTGEATIRVRHGGSGPPLLLLHGHPQTHVMWHLVAPRLASLPLFARVMLVTFVVVVVMTYLVMPRLTQLLKSWLYPE